MIIYISLYYIVGVSSCTQRSFNSRRRPVSEWRENWRRRKEGKRKEGGTEGSRKNRGRKEGERMDERGRE